MQISPQTQISQQNPISSKEQREARERTVDRCVKVTQSVVFLALSTIPFSQYSEYSTMSQNHSFMDFPYVMCGMVRIVMGALTIHGVASAAAVWLPSNSENSKKTPNPSDCN